MVIALEYALNTQLSRQINAKNHIDILYVVGKNAIVSHIDTSLECTLKLYL